MPDHVCPVWVGYLLASPVRRLFERPERLLAPYVSPGITVLDIGCAMGFYSLAAARMVGPDGRVVAVDLQPRMVEVLARRARRKGLADRLETRTCTKDSLGIDDLTGQIDLALAMFVAHEVPDAQALLHQIRSVLVSKGRLYVAEPKGHVSESDFANLLKAATGAGFALLDRPRVTRARAAVFEKP